MKADFWGRFRGVRNWTSLVGWGVASVSGFVFLLLVLLDFFAEEKSSYLGILTYLVVPLLAAGGLFLAGLGWILHRRKRAQQGEATLSILPVINFNQSHDRRVAALFFVAALVFVAVTSIGTYQGYHLTKSVKFCGMACHEAMAPQYVSYQHGPHARVECSACHVGGDPASFVKAKFNGLHQVAVTLGDRISRPILGHGKTHIDQKTCEQCHWPDRYVGNLDRTYTHFLDDDTNTLFPVRLLLKVGGGDPTHGPSSGIHWHMNLANRIEYIAEDLQRQKIPWIRLTETNGATTEFAVPGFTPDFAIHKVRQMDCMDCHNRPAHQFRTPNDSVELAMALGRLSTNLASIKRQAVSALTAPYTNTTQALAQIASLLRKQYGNRSETEAAITEVQSIYQRYFFPEMKTDWRTHPNNIGHKDWPGCFRCHDNEHVSPDGQRRINRQDCNSCHAFLTDATLGSDSATQQKPAFQHPEDGWQDMQCFDCHDGSTGGSTGGSR